MCFGEGGGGGLALLARRTGGSKDDNKKVDNSNSLSWPKMSSSPFTLHFAFDQLQNQPAVTLYANTQLLIRYKQLNIILQVLFIVQYSDWSVLFFKRESSVDSNLNAVFINVRWGLTIARLNQMFNGLFIKYQLLYWYTGIVLLLKS